MHSALARQVVQACARRAGHSVPTRAALRGNYTLTSRPRIAVPRARRGAQTQISAPTARFFATQSVADTKIEEIQELYATARDEFEIAAEETEKMTVYAEDDRAAAREELTKLQEAYKAIIEGSDKELGEEVKRRVGQRIRELENAVQAMEEMAQNQD